MKEFIVLSEPDILALYHNKIVTVHIDGKSYLICSDECFEKQKKDIDPDYGDILKKIKEAGESDD